MIVKMNSDARRFAGCVLSLVLSGTVIHGHTAPADEKAAVTISFFHRAAWGLNPGSLAFLRFRDPGKKEGRPLFVAGRPRWGEMRFFFKEGGLGKELEMRCEGTGSLDMNLPMGSRDALTLDDTAAAAILRKDIPLTVTISDVKLSTAVIEDKAWQEMLTFAFNGGKTVNPKTGRCEVEATIGIRTPKAATKITVPARMAIHFTGWKQWGNIRPFWRLEMESDFTLKGKAIGLTGSDAGPLDVHLALVTETSLPRDYSSSQVPDLPAEKEELEGEAPQ